MIRFEETKGKETPAHLMPDAAEEGHHNWTTSELLGEFQRQADKLEALHDNAEPHVKGSFREAVDRADRVKGVLDDVLEEGLPLREIFRQINEKEEKFREIALTSVSEGARTRASAILRGLSEARIFISNTMAGRRSFDVQLPSPGQEKQSSPGMEAREGSQEWLDLRREGAYDHVRGVIEKIVIEKGQEGFREWLRRYFNDAIAARGFDVQLTAADLASVEYHSAASESASRIADRPIVRPAFVFKDKEGFARFYNAIQGQLKTGTCDSEAIAMAIEITVPGQAGPQEISLIASKENGRNIGHEVRHTIDPYVHQRKGYDGVIEELFAYYQERIVDPREGTPAGSERAWQEFVASIWDTEGPGSYYAKYSEAAAKPVSHQEYGLLIQACARKLRELSQKHGDLETQRLLVQCQTVQELFAAA